jgi:RimJ/RimL family protein N-acetyltransferase
MTFAETVSLRIRGYRQSDLDHLVALFSDPRGERGDPNYIVPANETRWKKDIPGIFEKAFMACILEAKEPPADGNSWVGFVLLTKNGSPKNRDVKLAIQLDVNHWGRGYGKSAIYHVGARNRAEHLADTGTEATRWVVNHAFTQLDMHRVSLIVLSDNPSAIAVYRKVFVPTFVRTALGPHTFSEGSSKRVESARPTFRMGNGGM